MINAEEQILAELRGTNNLLSLILEHLRMNVPPPEQISPEAVAWNRMFEPKYKPIPVQEMEPAKDTRPLEVRLKEELDKVPAGTRYINAPNFKKLHELMKEATPIYPTPTSSDPTGTSWQGWKWTGEMNEFTFVLRADGRVIFRSWPKSELDFSGPMC